MLKELNSQTALWHSPLPNNRCPLQRTPPRWSALAEPSDHYGVRQLLGMASFYRRWISDFANMVAPLADMAKLVDDPKGSIDPKTLFFDGDTRFG